MQLSERKSIAEKRFLRGVQRSNHTKVYVYIFSFYLVTFGYSRETEIEIENISTIRLRNAISWLKTVVRKDTLNRGAIAHGPHVLV